MHLLGIKSDYYFYLVAPAVVRLLTVDRGLPPAVHRLKGPAAASTAACCPAAFLPAAAAAARLQSRRCCSGSARGQGAEGHWRAPWNLPCTAHNSNLCLCQLHQS